MKDFQNKVLKYLQARGWGKGNPADYAKSIVIEAGELLEHFQWSNPTPSELKADKEKFKKVQEEIADVMIYCFDLSVTLGFDMEKVLNAKLNKVIKKYPAKLMKDAKKASDDSPYWKIKKEYRAKK
jgi:NTP pyrophosphatase (non-canonical NTP hydrolase)